MGIKTPLTLGELSAIIGCTRLQPTTDGIRDTVYRTDRGVVKLFEDADLQSVREEKALLDALRSLPVAQIAGDVFYLRTRPCLLYRTLPGKSLERARETHIRQIGAFLQRFHRLSRGIRSRNEKLFERTRVEALVARTGDRRLRKIFETTRVTLHNDGVIHGDLFLDNALFVADTLSGVIDFSEACEGDFRLDLAVVAVSWCLEGTDPLLDVGLLLNHYDPSLTMETFFPYMRYALLYYATTRYLAGRDYGELLERISLLERLESGRHSPTDTLSLKGNS